VESLGYSASDIAAWFIDFNDRFVAKEDAELISPMKLEKLLYYAQAAFVAIDGKRLFDDEIEAWEHGPVVPAVYRTYKKYGASGIPESETGAAPSVNEHTNAMLFGVYEKYGKYSASELRRMTHGEEPYIDAVTRGYNSAITIESIKDYFTKTVYRAWLDDTLFDSIPTEEVA